MGYKPETAWQIKENLVYNLCLQRRGLSASLCWCNDVAISIEARHLSKEVQDDIAKTIMDALNKKYKKESSESNINE